MPENKFHTNKKCCVRTNQQCMENNHFQQYITRKNQLTITITIRSPMTVMQSLTPRDREIFLRSNFQTISNSLLNHEPITLVLHLPV